jgi:peptide/nickel transport system permease protein
MTAARKPLLTPTAKLVLGGSIVVMATAMAIFAPLIVPHDPYYQNLSMRMSPPMWAEGGSLSHPLGTDTYGRDLLSRIIYGLRISLLVGVASMLFSCTIGTLAGLFAGFKGGWLEQVIMRFADAHLSFPEILLAVMIVAVLGGSIVNLIIVLGVSSWMIYARIIFGLTRSIRTRMFVEAARSFGASDYYILFRHILPQTLPLLSVVATLQVAQMMLQETALSFLGLGLPPPAATLGNILAEGRDRIFSASWIANSAGIAVIILVWGVNMLGAGFREKRV